MKLIKSVIKAFIRLAVKLRLKYFPLDLQKAEMWAETIKRWPSIIKDEDVVETINISNELKMDLGIVDVVQRRLRIAGCWEPHVHGAIKKYLNPGDTFLDIGANIGYFSLIASKIVGAHGKVLSFEPSRRVLEKLLKNVAMNNCENVLVFSVGAGLTPKIQSLYWTTHSNIGASSIVEGVKYIKREMIAVVDLGATLGSLGVIPDVIKIDIEGAEFDVLSSLKRLFEEHGPVVICELNNDFLVRSNYSIKEIIDWMAHYDYKCLLIPENGISVMAEIYSSESANILGQIDVVFVKEK